MARHRHALHRPLPPNQNGLTQNCNGPLTGRVAGETPATLLKSRTVATDGGQIDSDSLCGPVHGAASARAHWSSFKMARAPTECNQGP